MNLAGESSFHLALLLAVSMLTAAVAGKLIGSFFHSRGFTTNGIFQEGGVTILSLLLAFLGIIPALLSLIESNRPQA